MERRKRLILDEGLGLRGEGDCTMWVQVPGHTGLEEQFVPKGSVRVHVKCNDKGDLALENGDSG